MEYYGANVLNIDGRDDRPNDLCCNLHDRAKSDKQSQHAHIYL